MMGKIHVAYRTVQHVCRFGWTLPAPHVLVPATKWQPVTIDLPIAVQVTKSVFVCKQVVAAHRVHRSSQLAEIQKWAIRAITSPSARTDLVVLATQLYTLVWPVKACAKRYFRGQELVLNALD